MSSVGSRNFVTTKDDHAGIALTVCTLLATWTVLCYAVRVQQRMTLASGSFGPDDIVCGIATFFAIVQTIVSGVAISDGFGKSLSLLTASQIVGAEKALYAAQLLYIVTLTMTKASMALMFARLMHMKSHVRVCYAVLTLSVVWGIGSFLAEAILCTVANPWILVGNKCPNIVLSWEAVTALNVITELIIAVMPLWLVWNLQTDRSRKVAVVMVFSLRTPIIAAAITRVAYLRTSIPSSQPLLTGVIPFICMEVEMHYGLMAATFPCLKPFIANFNTSWGTYDPSGTHGYGSSGNYARGARSGNEGDASASRNVRDPTAIRDDVLQSGNFKNVTQAWSDKNHLRRHNRLSVGSNNSQAGIIRQTVTCEVQFEERNEETRFSDRSSDHDKSVL